ncbi:MAG: hypothetical protein RR454_01360, partial [Clostridia bacterium]
MILLALYDNRNILLRFLYVNSKYFIANFVKLFKTPNMDSLIAMSISSIFVVGNALRLKFFKPSQN